MTSDLEDARYRAYGLLSATFAATLIIAVMETARVPFVLYSARAELFPGVLSLAVRSSVVRFAPTLTVLVLLALAGALAPSVPWIARAAVVLRLFGAAVVSFSLYRLLVRYEPFSTVALVKVAFVVLVPGVAWGLHESALPDEGARPGRRIAPRLGVALGLGAIACLLLDAKYFPGEYPTLHLSLLGISVILLAASIGLVPRLFRPDARWMRRVAWMTGGAVAALAFAPPSLSKSARPYFRSYTDLGRASAVFEPYRVGDEQPKGEVADDPEAVQRFRTSSGLPELPAEFDLGRFNVLLIASEATRFDQTSLADAALGTTPNLVALAEGGAFSFARAFSPSSSTLQSLAAIFGMSPASLLPLETWKKSWTGKLADSALTSAEVLRNQGYDTFWIGHDSRSYFSKAGLGLDQGFLHRELRDDDAANNPQQDSLIADRVVHAITARKDGAKRFFGFVFFVSPHSPYLIRDREARIESTLDVYRQELSYVDAQIGRVLVALRDAELDKTTIVVFLGDHGEEFGEHGGTNHKATVYDESIHVPFLIRVPGVPGRVMNAPVSTVYLFPWLFLAGTPDMRAAAEERLRRAIGPMMRATRGAVVSELIGHDRMKSALVYPRESLLYDFIAERYEAYATDRDPTSSNDRFGIDARLSLLATERIEAYRTVRAARRRFELRPDVEDRRRKVAPE